MVFGVVWCCLVFGLFLPFLGNRSSNCPPCVFQARLSQKDPARGNSLYLYPSISATTPSQSTKMFRNWQNVIECVSTLHTFFPDDVLQRCFKQRMETVFDVSTASCITSLVGSSMRSSSSSRVSKKSSLLSSM